MEIIVGVIGDNYIEEYNKIKAFAVSQVEKGIKGAVRPDDVTDDMIAIAFMLGRTMKEGIYKKQEN